MVFNGWIDSVKDQLAPEVKLESWKQEYVDFLMERGIMKFGNFKLKSGRRASTFLNYGDASDGESVLGLGQCYAAAILENVKSDFKTIVGPAYKGISLAVATSIALAQEKKNVSFTFDRKEEKSYGEATDASKEAAGKRIFVGYVPKNGDKILLEDDVITTGATKIDEINKLKSVANVELVGLMIGGNRQEIDENGNDAVKELSDKLKIPVYSLVNVYSEAIPYLWNKKIGDKEVIDEPTKRRLTAYARAYGTEDVKKWCRDIKLIERDKGIIPACDVPLDVFETLVKATGDIEQVVAYKIPATSGREGWETWVKTARKYTDKPLIYDHQKAGTDIPDTGKDFMKAVKESGFDAVIVFPHSGTATQQEWIHSAFEQDLEVLAGSEMTHPRFKRSEGGYIDDDSLLRSLILSARLGVNNFVVPGNKLDRITLYKDEIEKAIPEIKPRYHSPGLVLQGGNINDVTKLLEHGWCGIVGRGIYGDKEKNGRYNNETEMREATFDHGSKL